MTTAAAALAQGAVPPGGASPAAAIPDNVPLQGWMSHPYRKSRRLSKRPSTQFLEAAQARHAMKRTARQPLVLSRRLPLSLTLYCPKHDFGR